MTNRRAQNSEGVLTNRRVGYGQDRTTRDVYIITIEGHYFPLKTLICAPIIIVGFLALLQLKLHFNAAKCYC